MLGKLDRKRFEIFGLMPIEIDDKIAGVRKNVSSIKAMADAYGYGVFEYRRILVLYNALKVIPVAMLKGDAQLQIDDEHEIEKITTRNLNRYSQYGLCDLIENIEDTTGCVPRIIDMANVSWREFNCLDEIFAGCKSISCIDMPNWSTGELSQCSAEDMFRGCNSLKKVLISKKNNPVIVSELQRYHQHIEIIEPQ